MKARVSTLLAGTGAKIRHVRQRNSDTQMDLIKLYGMFLVVFAHCYFQGMSVPGFGVVSSVYVIQLFIFCSGYFYSRESDGDPRYLLKCVRGYLVPYFCWNLVYGVVREILAAVGIIQFGSHLSLYSLLIRPWLDGEQYALNIPSWFLLSLFLTAVCVWALRSVLKKLGKTGPVWDTVLFAVLLAVSLVTLFWVGQGGYYLKRGAVARPLILLPYFQLGILYRTYGKKLGRKAQAGLLVLLVLVIVGVRAADSGLKTKMLYCYFVGNPVLLLTAALASVGIVTLVCGFLAPLFRKCRLIRYGGRCTMSMMLHHMAVLWGIQAVFFVVNHFYAISGFDAANFKASIWYRFCFCRPRILIFYFAVAMAVPMAVHWLYECIILKICESSGESLYKSENMR